MRPNRRPLPHVASPPPVDFFATLPYASAFPWKDAIAELRIFEEKGCDACRALLNFAGIIARAINPRPLIQSQQDREKRGE